MIIAVSILLGLIYTLPNFYGESPAVQISPLRTTAKADTALLQRVEDALKKANLPASGMFLEEGGVKVRFADTDTQIKARDTLQSALGNGYMVALNLLPNSPQWLTSIGALPMYLGLDLRGGVHFMLQVDMKGATAKALDRFSADIRGSLREKKIPYAGLDKRGSQIIVKFRNPESRAQAEAEIKKSYADLNVREDNVGSEFHLTATLKPEAHKLIQDSAVQQNITTLRNRVNELGVAEPIIQQAGADRVVVQLPGVQDTAKAKDILGRTATLEVRMVDEEHDLSAALRGQIPFGAELYTERGGGPLLVKKQVVLTGDRMNDAQAGFDNNNQPAVHLNLDNNGARIFRQLTKDNVGKRMAILLIEKNQAEVITAPVIREEIGGGRVQISGRMTTEEARDVALLLRAGALAAPMDIIEERTVGPSLGADNIAKGIDASLWGMLFVSLFIVAIYRFFGVLATLALGLNMVLLLALMSLLSATLTLPGIAGIVLTMGMAVDANVLIFSRIREEIANGMSVQRAIHEGFDRAFSAIVDGNLTTLLVGGILFAMGSGPVKGFAVTLSLGILTSMFTAILVTRAMVNLSCGGRDFKKLWI